MNRMVALDLCDGEDPARGTAFALAVDYYALDG